MQDPLKMPANDNIEHIELPVLAKGQRSGKVEFVEVERTKKGNRYQIFCPPALVEGIAVGDVIELSPEEPQGFKVTHHSGNLTVWLTLADTSQYSTANQEIFDKAFTALGGVFEGCAKQKTVTFSVHITAGFDKIEKVCDELTSLIPEAKWQYGNVYDWNNEPLNWWIDEIDFADYDDV